MIKAPKNEDDLDNVIAPVEKADPIHLPKVISDLPKVTSSLSVSPEAPEVAKKRTTKKIPDDIRKKVKELYASGQSVRQIATTLGISKTTAATINNEIPVMVPLAAQVPLAENISINTIEPMDDASFANAITSSAPAVSTVAIKPLSKSSIDKILAEFSGPDVVTGPSTGKPKKSRAKDASGLDDLLAEFEPSVSAPLAKSKKTTFAMPVEQFEDKSVYIAKIQMNVDNFADVLKDHIKPDRDGFLTKVSKMSLSDLNSTLKLLETVRSSNNLANQMKYLLYGGANFIELGTQRLLGMKTQGYAQQLRQQEAEIQSCLREIAINNVEAYKKIEKPEMRLATVLVTTLIATDSRNRLEGLKNEFKTMPVSTEQQNKFNDL
jgi:hypothetical protein